MSETVRADGIDPVPDWEQMPLEFAAAPRTLVDEPEPLLVSVVQAAKLLGVGRTTAYELIGSGELEVVHIGRAVRVPVEAVRAYVERLRRRHRPCDDGGLTDA